MLRAIGVEAPAPLPESLSRRDPAFIRRLLPWLELWTRTWYRGRIEGLEGVPPGPVLIVSTHNGAGHVPDMFLLMAAWWLRFGVETPGYAMMHNFVKVIPWFGDALERCGAIPATPEAGEAVLRAGHPLLVCPGGDEDALKPYRDRHKVVFGRRRGFLRLAMRVGVPVVPVVSVGAHEVIRVLNDGRATAKALRLDRLFRLKTLPLTWSFPFGLTIAGVPSFPLPSRVAVRVLPPLSLEGDPRDGADVERAHDFVRDAMQAGLDGLVRDREMGRV